MQVYYVPKKWLDGVYYVKNESAFGFRCSALKYDINFIQWDYERIVLNVIDCFNFPQLFGFCLL